MEIILLVKHVEFESNYYRNLTQDSQYCVHVMVKLASIQPEKQFSHSLKSGKTILQTYSLKIDLAVSRHLELNV